MHGDDSGKQHQQPEYPGEPGYVLPCVLVDHARQSNDELRTPSQYPLPVSVCRRGTYCAMSITNRVGFDRELTRNAGRSALTPMND